MSNLSVAGKIKNCGLKPPLYILMTPHWSFFVLCVLFSLQSLAGKMSTSFRATGSIPSIDNMAMVFTQILGGFWSGSFATRLYWSDSCCHWKRSSSTRFSPSAATNQAKPIGICDLRLILSKQNAPWCHQGFLRILNPLNWCMGWLMGRKVICIQRVCI